MTLTLSVVYLALSSRDAFAVQKNGCSAIEVVFARGSGQGIGDMEADRFQSQLRARFKGSYKVNFHELGSGVYAGFQYPAVSVDNVLNGNAIGAKISRGFANDYGNSVKQGVSELTHYMVDRMHDCRGYGSKFVLAGYSQGAQVIGQFLAVTDTTMREHILYAAFFGDPKLHLPEGEGVIPPACYGADRSVYRRVIGDCRTDNGSLGARKPYLPVDMHEKSGLWCYAHDFVCGSTKNIWDHTGHGLYGVSGNAVDQAAYEVAFYFHSQLPLLERSNVDVGKINKVTLEGLNTVFVVNTTSRVEARFPEIKESIAAVANQITPLGGRVSLVAYSGEKGDSDEWMDSSSVHCYRSLGAEDFARNVDALFVTGNFDSRKIISDTLTHVRDYCVGMHAYGPNILVVLISGVEIESRSSLSKRTTASMGQNAFSDLSSNIYIAPFGAGGSVDDLLDGFSRNLFVPTQDEQLEDVVMRMAVAHVDQPPVAILKNTAYIADVNKMITFDASDSYALDGTITKYEWDFNGDGVFDYVTADPVAKTSYGDFFDGVILLRLTASNGVTADVSATVRVGMYTPPSAPLSPRQLELVSSDRSSAVLRWQAGDLLAVDWAVASDGLPIAKVRNDVTEVIISDLKRDEPIEVSVAGITADGVLGDFASIIIPKMPDEIKSKEDRYVDKYSSDETTALNSIIQDFTAADEVGRVLMGNSFSIANVLRGDEVAPSFGQQATVVKGSQGTGWTEEALAWLVGIIMFISWLTVWRRQCKKSSSKIF